MKRVELLAPAGNWEGLIGAILAGADAVYLGGHKFGARAYANNFSQEELCCAIRYAHVRNCSIYLTINTLFKDEELLELEEYLVPYVKEGLDGVIIQDLGALVLVKDKFPTLEIHISTQMSIMGEFGAELVKEMGACRVVPARELSLDEIISIKQTVDIELETFVHGAMCYCYSGSCLFSSMLGGRSGNRGRCAQPCRLPYEVMEPNVKTKTKTKNHALYQNKDKKFNYKRENSNDNNRGNLKEDSYPLSLKDMCTLSNLPQLIEAGIDSFKIEGRMKKPEYAAGVVALYRHYIDLYYQLKENEKEAQYHVSKKDLAQLQKLYMRSDIQDGYYFKHNGSEMVTIEKPHYNGVDEELLQSIRQQYINQEKKIEVRGEVTLKIGEEIVINIYDDKGHKIQVKGDLVLEAINRPMEESSVKKQIGKTGSSQFSFAKLKINMIGNCFLPIKSLNEVRRVALLKFEEVLLANYHLTPKRSNEEMFKQEIDQDINQEITKKEKSDKTNQVIKHEKNIKYIGANFPSLVATVLTWEQFKTVLTINSISIIYLPIDCLLSGNKQLAPIKGIEKKELYLLLPYILRKRSYTFLEKMKEYLGLSCVKGVVVRNLEEVQWLKEIEYSKDMITDANIYCFNQESKKYLFSLGFHATTPYELNKYELKKLGCDSLDMVIYGKIPMMITANCVNTTMSDCKKAQNAILKDRYQKEFFVYMNCLHCYNVIYNSVPLSLHQSMEDFIGNYNRLRLDFTDENPDAIVNILDYFNELLSQHKDAKQISTHQILRTEHSENYDDVIKSYSEIKAQQRKSKSKLKCVKEPPYLEYTKGHWKRGVE